MAGMWGSFYWDWTIFLLIPGIIVALWAQSKVNRAYDTYTKIPVLSGMSGSEAAFRILSGGRHRRRASRRGGRTAYGQLQPAQAGR